MLFPGRWHLCDDGVIRPILLAEIQTGAGGWEETPFLIDTGADRTVICADELALLGLPAQIASQGLGGVGGPAATIEVETQLRLTDEAGNKATFRGRYAAFTDPMALDMSVLGGDVFRILAVIVDRPKNVVRLLAPNHDYSIFER